MNSGFRNTFLAWGFIYDKFICSKAYNAVILICYSFFEIHCILQWNYMGEWVSKVYLSEIIYFTNLSKFCFTSVYPSELNPFKSCLNEIIIMYVTLC